LHRSLLERGVLGGKGGTADDFAPAMYGINVVHQGNTLRCIPVTKAFTAVLGQNWGALTRDQRLAKLPPPGITTPQLLEEMKERMSDEQLHVLSVAPPQVGNLFPNVNILFIYSPLRDGTLGSGLLLHTMVPKGPYKFEWLTWFFAEKDTPAAVKELMLSASIRAGGTSGLIEQDDSDTWPHMTESATGMMGRTETLKYQAIGGINRPHDWPNQAEVYDGFSKDDAQWSWWLQYYKLMTA
jgi:hypothetical protein